ncbi:hypothetical protein Tco_1229464 [Tanacetum coccineum]
MRRRQPKDPSRLLCSFLVLCSLFCWRSVWAGNVCRFFARALLRKRSLDAFFREVEGGIFYQDLGHWACHLREIFYESSVEAGMFQKASDGFQVCGICGTSPSLTQDWSPHTSLASFSKFLRHWSKELPKTEKSSMNTSMLSSISSWNMAVIQRWKVVDVLHNPNGIYLYAKVPYGQVNVVFY